MKLSSTITLVYYLCHKQIIYHKDFDLLCFQSYCLSCYTSNTQFTAYQLDIRNMIESIFSYVIFHPCVHKQIKKKNILRFFS